MLVVCAAAPLYAATDGAHFWISATGAGSSGPEAPTIPMTLNQTTTIYIWGRPREGRQFQSVSLNLIADGPSIDFVDGTYSIENTITTGVSRFEFTRDSSTVPTLTSVFSEAEVIGGDTDALEGINAFNLFGGPPTYLGMGPTCSAGEMDCEMVGDGEPAWLIASVDIKAVTAPTTASLYLQVGDRGVVEQTLAAGDYDFNETVDAPDHAVWAASLGSTTLLAADGADNDVIDAADYTVYRDNIGLSALLGTVGDTEVRFGVDAGAGIEPLHNALDDQETNLTGDDPDAMISITVSSLAVPEPASGVLTALAGAWLGFFSGGFRRLPARAH